MKDMEKDFEKIGKEITKMKKSVTARDVVNRTEELLKENGVVVNVTTCNFEGVTEMSIELDFSEHDKVFEDKIAKLQKEVENYKQAFDYKCSDFNSQTDILEKFISQNEELEQRIAELESKLEMYESECDPRNHSKELHYFAIAQNQFFRKENERLKNKNKILYDYIHGITGNTEDEIDKNIKSLESNKNHVDIKATATPMDISTHLINNTCTINELEQIAEHLLVYCKHNKESEG